MNRHSAHAMHARVHPRILLASVASIVAAPFGFGADAVFSSGAFTSDADSGVSTAKTYTAIANIIGADVSVNGTTFIGSGAGLSGTNWSLAGVPNNFGSGGNHTSTFGGSVIDDLFDGFQYNGNPATLTMSGLTAGQVYTVTLYSQAWGLGEQRVSTVSSTEGATTVHNQDALEASALRYTFVATGTSTDLAFSPKAAGNTFHFYGVSNEQVFTNTWTPTSGTSWNTAANWSKGVVPNSLGSNASFSAQAGPTNVNLSGSITAGHIEFLGTGAYTISGTSQLTLEADAGGVSVLKADAGATHTIATPILQINSPLAKFGAGTVRFTGPVSGSGKGITIGSGKLGIENATADLSSLGNISNSGTFAITNAAEQKIDTIISGTGGFEKSGASVLTLGGHQTYSGPTVIQGGTLKLSPITSLTIPNASFATYDSLASGSFGYAPTGASWTFTTGNSGIALNGSPWFAPTNHDGSAAGFIQGGTASGTISQTINVVDAGYYNLGFQGVARAGNGPMAILLQIDGTTVKTFDAAEFSEATWQNYAAAVQLSAGSHTLAFVGANFIGGDRATVIDAVTAATGGRLPQNSAVSLTGAGVTLDLSGAAQTIGSLAGVAGTSVINEGSLVAGGDGTSTSFAGVISGAGSFTKAGAGTLELGGANIYGGPTTISGGTLQLAGGTIASGSALSLTAPGAAFVSGGTAMTISALSGVAGSTVNLAAGALTVGDAATTTFAGSLTAGGLTKQGNGTLTLSGPSAYSGGATVAAGTLKTETTNTGAAGAMTVAVGATWDLALANHAVTGLSGGGTVTRSGVLSTGADGSALITGTKNYALKLDFGNNAGATVNGVTFDNAGTTGTGFALTGAGTQFGEAALTGYDQLVSDFYYGGNPGTLTFNTLIPGQTYEAVLYTKVGHWANRAQNATFDEDGAGPISQQLLNSDPGNLGYYAYKFVAHSASMSVSMAPLNAANTFHWFAASLENISAAAPTLTVGDAANYSFTGSINGPTALVKQGSGIQELGGASNYSGGTNISAGTITSHHAAALGTGPVSIASGANYLAWWKTGSSVVTNDFTLSGPGGFSPGGDKTAIYADGGVNGFPEYTLAGTITLVATSNLGGHTINNLRVLGPIVGIGGLTKGGDRTDENNTLILGNTANNYVGDTSITKGTVKLANSEVIPHGAGKGGVVMNAGTSLDLGGFSETINSLSGAGVITSTASVGVPVYFTDDTGTGISATKTYTHALDFTESTGVSINGVAFEAAGLSGANYSLTGAGSVAGNAATGATGDISRLLTNFYYNGNPAVLTLTGLTAGVTYETRLYERRWGGDRSQLFTTDAGSGTGTTIFNSDANGAPSFLPLRFTANASGQATISTNQIGDGTYHWYGFTNEVVSGPMLTVGDANSTTFGGSITGPLGLTKNGAGSLTLAGANDYTGATAVTAGKLLVNGSLSGTASVNVSGGTLGGSGMINPAANITVLAGGEIAPGSGIGTLSTGPILFEGGSMISMELGTTTGDQLKITGGASIAGTISLSLALLADPVDNTVFTLIDGTTFFVGYGTGGRFNFSGNSLDQGEIFSVTTGIFSQAFQISYSADGGNDVTLVAVPEPASTVILMCGATLLAARRRRS